MNKWFYKAFGEEYGPVSFERLQEMALKNQLSPQDRVRSTEWKEWVTARTVPQLFPKHRLEAEPEAVEQIDDVDFASIELADGKEERELSLDDMDIQVSDARTTAQVSGRVDAYGSLIEEDLPTAESQPGSLDDLDIQIADAPSSANASGPTDAYGSPITDSAEGQYICLSLGHELGPMPFEDLRLMAKKGELGLDDQVRREDDMDWRPARTVEGLFPGFEYTSAPESSAGVPAAEMPAAPPAEEPPPDPKSAGPNGQSPKPAEKPTSRKSSKKKKRRSKPENLQKWLSDEVPSEPEQPVESQPAEEAEPIEEAPAAPPPEETLNPAAAYQARMAEIARQQAAAPKSPAAKAKVQGPSLGERFSGLGEKLKENPKVLGVVAVLALVVMIKYVPWPFGKGNLEFFTEITEIGNEVKNLRVRKAGAAEIDTFKKQAMPKLNALEKELKGLAGSGSPSKRAKQEMLWAVGNLKTILEGGQFPKEPTETEKLYDRQMVAAQALMEGKTPPPPPPSTASSNEP